MKDFFIKTLNEYKSFLENFIKDKNPTRISLDELPLYSEWPDRLLEIKPAKIYFKSIKEIIREYDKEKWNEKLNLFTKSEEDFKSVPQFRDYDVEELSPRFILGKYYLLREKDYNFLQVSLLSLLLKGLKFKTIVELGAGYGAMLLDIASSKEFSNVYFKGGDISPNAIKLFNLLSKKFHLKADSFLFNFMNPKDYGIIENNSIVFTCHSLMYIPTINESIISNIIKRRPALIINLEPICPENNQLLSNLMIKKYYVLNDYNRNLKKMLYAFEKNKSIDILYESKPLLGNNPFIPFSVIVWKPKN